MFPYTQRSDLVPDSSALSLTGRHGVHEARRFVLFPRFVKERPPRHRVGGGVFRPRYGRGLRATPPVLPRPFAGLCGALPGSARPFDPALSHALLRRVRRVGEGPATGLAPPKAGGQAVAQVGAEEHAEGRAISRARRATHAVQDGRGLGGG